MGWVTPAGRASFPKPLRDYIHGDSPIGEVGVVETANGFHLLKIDSVKTKAEHINLLMLSKIIEPSKLTIDSVENVADLFFEKYDSPDSLAVGAEAEGYTKTTSTPFGKNQYGVQQIPNSREIVTWTHYSDIGVGDMKLFFMEDRSVVAVISDVSKGQFLSLESVRVDLESQLINKKKAEIIAQKLSGSAGSLESMAGAYNATIETANDQAPNNLSLIHI